MSSRLIPRILVVTVLLFLYGCAGAQRVESVATEVPLAVAPTDSPSPVATIAAVEPSPVAIASSDQIKLLSGDQGTDETPRCSLATPAGERVSRLRTVTPGVSAATALQALVDQADNGGTPTTHGAYVAYAWTSQSGATTTEISITLKEDQVVERAFGVAVGDKACMWTVQP